MKFAVNNFLSGTEIRQLTVKKKKMKEKIVAQRNVLLTFCPSEMYNLVKSNINSSNNYHASLVDGDGEETKDEDEEGEEEEEKAYVSDMVKLIHHGKKTAHDDNKQYS